MIQETTEDPKPTRGRPRKETPEVSNDTQIPQPPPLDPVKGLKTEEMMDWFYTYLPQDIAQAVYSGLRYTPSHLRA